MSQLQKKIYYSWNKYNKWVNSTTKKEIIDSIYDAAVVVGLTIGYGLIGKKVFGMTRPSAKLNKKDTLKLTGYVSVAMMTRDYMVDKG